MTQKILVIDHERSTRNRIIQLLQAEGYEAIGAENGRIGIELAQENLPDLIICDILMPGLDGYDILTILQQNPQTASIPFIFLTVAASESSDSRRWNGVDDYLSKSVSSEQLRNVIARRLTRRSSSRRSSLRSGTSDAGLQPLVEAKDRLLNRLSQQIPQQLAQISTALQQLKDSLNAPPEESLRRFAELQQAIAAIQTTVDEVVVVQTVLTPENAEQLMQQLDLWEE